jgi:predicted small secreted protein
MFGIASWWRVAEGGLSALGRGRFAELGEGKRMGGSVAKLLSVALLLLLGACNTMHGLGRDMSAAGNWVAGTADSGEPAKR